MHNFERCIGVELLESLYQKSCELKAIYDHIHENKAMNPENKRLPQFEVYQGDLLEYDWWSTADLVIANSTCFDF